MNLRRLVHAAVILLPLCVLRGQNTPAPMLNIVIVEGEGAINNIKQRTARETIVEVQDENHKPVAGAAVVFLLPNDGPGGAFAGGAKTANVTTNSAGRATMPRMQLNPNSGNFQIRVNASSAGRQGSAVISQSSALGAAGAAGAGISAKTILIIVAVAGAAAAGAAIGLTRGNSKSSTTTTTGPPTGTISLGSGATVGPPN